VREEPEASPLASYGPLQLSLRGVQHGKTAGDTHARGGARRGDTRDGKASRPSHVSPQVLSSGRLGTGVSSDPAAGGRVRWRSLERACIRKCAGRIGPDEHGDRQRTGDRHRAAG
jgi:hypothetical protein